MTTIDYIVFVVVLVVLFAFVSQFASRAGHDTNEFLLAGRKMPWWLAGLSVIATGINTSTPLLDARKIRSDGIGGLWFEWQAVTTTSIGMVWFNRLWRRAGISTPLEFYAIRYAGWPASAARMMDVAAISAFNGVIWTATGLLGFRKIATVLFGMPETVMLMGMAVPGDWLLILPATVLALFFATLSGVYSVVWTDVFEAVIAVGIAYVLFFMAFAEVGWSVGLRTQIEALGSEGGRLLRLLPEFGPAMLVLFVLQPIVSQGQWSPGIQRFLAVKDEREVLVTTYFSSIVNWVFRPWPFLILGLCGIFILGDAALLEKYPAIQAPNGALIPDYEMVFPAMAVRYLPAGLIGLLMAGFMISFMGSLASNVHSNAALFMNDFYRSYVFRTGSERHYVNVTRVYMVLMTAVAVFISLAVDSILALVIIALMVNNCSGLVKALRFVWWRINGWAEFGGVLVGLVTVSISFTTGGEVTIQHVGRLLGQESNDAYYAIRFMFVTGSSTLVSCVLALITPPEPMAKLCEFYRRMRPYGWWGPVAQACPESYHGDPIWLLWAMTFAGLAYVFGGIFAAAGLLLAYWWLFGAALCCCLGGYLFLRFGTERLYPKGPATSAEG